MKKPTTSSEKLQSAFGAPPLDEVPLKRTYNKPFRNKANLVHPEIYSTDVRYMNLLAHLADLTEDPRFAPSSAPSGSGLAGANAITAELYMLRTLSGFSMPAAIPVRYNDKVRAEAGVPATAFLNPRHKAIALGVGRAMFGSRRDAAASFQKAATTAAPKFLTSVLYKEAILEHILRHSERLVALIMEGDVHGLRREFDAVATSFILHRLQADSVSKTEAGHFTSKERLIPDWLYVESSGEKGGQAPADKRIWLNGQLLTDFFAQRRRAVYAFNGVLNYFMTMLLAQPRAHYLSHYEFTFKHTTPAQIQAKFADSDAILKFDVSNMDRTVPRFAAECLCEILDEFYHPAFSKLVMAAFTAPYFQPPTGTDRIDARWIGDPSKFGGETFPGLPSGIAINPDMGKWWMTSCALIAADDQFGDVLESLEDVLLGRHPLFRIADSSDDMLIGITRTELTLDWRDKMDKMDTVSPYMKMKLEGSSFLGNVLYEDANGKLNLAPDITSFLKNWLVPEHALDHPARRNWGMGWQARSRHYQKAPMYSEMKYELDDAWMRYLPGVPTIDQAAAAAAKQQGIDSAFAMTDADELFLRKPEMLHYALSASDITPELLAQFSLSVSAERLEPLYQKYYRGRKT